MRLTPSQCPDPEVLAAFLDGRLSAAERTVVIEHLADCADCYAVFVEAVHTQSGGRWAWAEKLWRRVVEASGWTKAMAAAAGLAEASGWTKALGATAGLAAAASLALIVQPQLVTEWWRGGPKLDELIAAVGTERTIEPRLTGGFEYGPLIERSAKRSGERAEERLSPELRIAALTLEKRVQERRDPSSLSAYATAQLVTGQADRAVSALEEAVRLAPGNARVQNDLSAAYLVRFKQKQELEDVTRAVTAATAAIEADPSLPEARFNLALALEAQSRRNEAQKAWEAYLKIDSKSGWAEEARRHLELLAPEKQSRRLQDKYRLATA